MDTSEFTDEQIEALQALADGYNDQSVSRRDVMKLVGAGGVGALLGGGGAVSTVGKASAGTAQSGQLGAVGDPVDIEAEDVNAQSVTTSELGAAEEFASGYGSDTAAIQSALSEQGISPSVVHADVTTSVDSALSIPSNTVLLIEGDLTLAAGASHNLIENENDTLDHNEAGHDENIYIIGNGGKLDGNRANVTYNGSDSFLQNPIMLHGVENCGVKNCVIENSSVHGAIFGACKNLTTDGNVIDSVDFVGLMATRNKTTDLSGDNIVQKHNVVSNTGEGSSSTAIVTQAVAHGSVHDNRVFSIPSANAAIGVSTEDAGLVGEDVSVTGNTIDGTGTNGEGIFVRTAGSGNTNKIVISGNSVRDGFKQGIHIRADGNGNTTEIIVNSNTVTGGTVGIRLVADTNTLENSSVSGNIVTDIGSNGISIVGASDCLVFGNLTDNTERRGIYMDGATRVRVIANSVRNSGPSATNGIELLGCTDCTVMSNISTDTDGVQTHGISTDANCTGTVVILNDVRGNTTAGTTLGGTGTITDPVGGGTAEDWNIT